MQMIPSQSKGEPVVYEWLRNFKFEVALGYSLLVVFFHFLDVFFNKNTKLHRWARSFLKQVANDHLGGNSYHTRVTIMVKRKGYQIIIKRLFYFIVYQFWKNSDAWDEWKKAFKSIPWHVFKDYLVVFERYSYPKCKQSYTYFRLDDEDANGVAARCYQIGTSVIVKTSPLLNINWKSNFKDLNKSDKRKVKKYMDKTFLSENNYNTLLYLRKKANNMYAYPIFDENEDIIGVFIIDNDEKDFPDTYFSQLDTYIGEYIKLLSLTISQSKH
jgi:hypothetical protein